MLTLHYAGTIQAVLQTRDQIRPLEKIMHPSKVLKDDRVFRLEVVAWNRAVKGRAWVVVAIHNVIGRIPARQDYFATREDALDYYLKIVVETPRASLGDHSPDPLPSIEQYTAWLKSENIYDPVLNPGKSPD
jgi:hypothetical protein